MNIYKDLTKETIVSIYEAIKQLNETFPMYTFSMPPVIHFEHGSVKYSIAIDAHYHPLAMRK